MRWLVSMLLGATVFLVLPSPSRALERQPSQTAVLGAGATFPQPLYRKWSDAYRRVSGVDVSYRGTGSGDGVKQIQAATVAFGASDRPLPPSDLAGTFAQFPALVGGIVPVVDLPGIDPGALVLSGPVLSQIYRNAIRHWDDPAIAGLNPGLALPHLPITVVHRSDASGTTFVFSGYLTAVDAEWRASVGAGTTVTWPVGQGAVGNDGVAALVGRTEGAIGYVDYAVAKSANLAYTALINKAAKTVQPTPASFAAAAARADWPAGDGFAANLLDRPGQASWPITTATYVLVRRGLENRMATRAALEFFRWGLTHGGSIVEDLDYVPIPADVIATIVKDWESLPQEAPGSGQTR